MLANTARAGSDALAMAAAESSDLAREAATQAEEAALNEGVGTHQCVRGGGPGDSQTSLFNPITEKTTPQKR